MSKTLIFDFDGTVADTLPFTVNTALQLNRELKLLNQEKINIEKFRSMDLSEFVKGLNIPTIKLLYFLFKSQRMLNKNIKTIPTFSGLSNTLAELKRQNIKIGIVTSNSKKNVVKFLTANNLNYFDFIYSTIHYFHKNRLLEKAIKKQKLDNEDVIYIGDEVRDIKAARAAGVKIAVVTWGYNLESLLATYKPDFIINQPKELLNLVRE